MLRGTYTAIVTPFAGDAIDEARFRALIDAQVEAGVAGIVPAGTTGESPTLGFDEHIRLIETAVDACAGRIQVIAGTGANSTAEALTLTKGAKDAGADATLQVTPYYNKPSQEGLFRHFSAVADLGLPVVLYNVPGRSACEIALETVVRLAEHPSVVAIKEAAGDADRVHEVLRACEMTVLSGDDSLTLPMIALGATGVISVASNVVPAAVATMVNNALDGRWTEAQLEHARLYQLFSDLFLETNPIPVKAALGMMGLIEEVYRLPLCEMNPALRARLEQTLRDLELLPVGGGAS